MMLFIGKDNSRIWENSQIIYKVSDPFIEPTSIILVDGLSFAFAKAKKPTKHLTFLKLYKK